MPDAILVLNAGSSSVKFALVYQNETLKEIARGQVSGIGDKASLHLREAKNDKPHIKKLDTTIDQEGALKEILRWVEAHETAFNLTTVVHRIVHGGDSFISATRLTDLVMAKLQKLIPLAPLHQSHNLAAVDITRKLIPEADQIACFDTAFHAHHDALFTTFALPAELRDSGVRRYGFHGLSFNWIRHVLKHDYPALLEQRVIVAHLGNGSSICAMSNGRSIDTTMSMTPLDGLPMGTRSGAVDPGALLYLLREHKMSADELEHLLYEKSGLKALSGTTNDVEALLDSTDSRAKFAIHYLALKVAQYMAMMAVSMGGVDAIVFTGGIGEHAEAVRDLVLERLAWLGERPFHIIPANEERMMAIEAYDLVTKRR